MQNSHFITLIRENFFLNTGAAGLDKREFSILIYIVKVLDGGYMNL